MDGWYRFLLRWCGKFYFPTPLFCQTLSQRSNIQYSVHFLLHLTPKMLRFNIHHASRYQHLAEEPVASLQPSYCLSVLLSLPLLRALSLWNDSTKSIYLPAPPPPFDLFYSLSSRLPCQSPLPLCCLKPCKLSKHEVQVPGRKWLKSGLPDDLSHFKVVPHPLIDVHSSRYLNPPRLIPILCP